MYYFFRVDASSIIGTGHIARCLTLAKKLGKKCIFICANHEGNLIKEIKEVGYKVHIITPDGKPHGRLTNTHATWLQGSYQNDALATISAIKDHPGPKTLIIDHYAIFAPWQALLRPHVSHIMVIDDLADRRHDCDSLLDSNSYLGMQTRYDNLIPKDCIKMLGISYALLRDEFKHTKKRLRTAKKNIFVFFGGVDIDNYTSKVVAELCCDLNVTVLVGSQNPHKAQVAQLCKQKGFAFQNSTNDIASIMEWADLAIGAGGTTSWERIVLGLPCIIHAIAANQEHITSDIISQGLALPAGTSIDDINITEISQNCLNMPYNDGAAKVAKTLQEHTCKTTC